MSVCFNIKIPLSASLDPSCACVWCMSKISLWGVQWRLCQQICQFLRGRQLFFITHFFWSSTVEPQSFPQTSADVVDCRIPLCPTCLHFSLVSNLCHFFCSLQLVISLYLRIYVFICSLLGLSNRTINVYWISLNIFYWFKRITEFTDTNTDLRKWIQT